MKLIHSKTPNEQFKTLLQTYKSIKIVENPYTSTSTLQILAKSTMSVQPPAMERYIQMQELDLEVHPRIFILILLPFQLSLSPNTQVHGVSIILFLLASHIIELSYLQGDG